MLRSPPVVLETPLKSYLRSSRTPVILKANEHGYDSITVLQYWKTIPTAKQNKMNCTLMRNVTALMVLSCLKNY